MEKQAVEWLRYGWGIYSIGLLWFNVRLSKLVRAYSFQNEANSVSIWRKPPRNNYFSVEQLMNFFVTKIRFSVVHSVNKTKKSLYGKLYQQHNIQYAKK